MNQSMKKLFALLLLLPALAFGQAQISSVKAFGAVCNDTADDTAAFQKAMNAGNFYVPAGVTCYLASPVNAVSNRLIKGPGAIDRKAAYLSGTIAAFYVDSVTNVTFDGLTFISGAVHDREAAVFLRDTSAPTADITVKNSYFTYIKGITTWDGSGAPGGLFPAHYTGAYPPLYYETDSHLHRRITFTDNTLVNPTATADTNGFAVYCWFCRDVLVARNKIKDLYGVAYIRGGDPGNANWSVNAQASYNHIVENNVADVQWNGIVLIGVRNSIVANNVITAASGSGEMLDSEGGREILFKGNTITGYQQIASTFFTNKNVIFDGNYGRTTAYVGGAGGLGVYNAATTTTDPNIADSGTIIFRNNTFRSDVGEAWIGPGVCNECLFENNHFLNISFYSGGPTNLLTVRGNTFDFTVAPTFKNLIQVGGSNTALWDPAASSPTPRIEIKDNIVNGLAAAGIAADAINVMAFTQAGTMDVTGNRLDNTGGFGFHLMTGGGVARTIVFKDNFVRNDVSTVPFKAEAPIGSDLLFWYNNRKFTGQDTFSAITGVPAANLTVDAKAITQSGSTIYNIPAAASAYGWTYDAAGAIWRPFGTTF